MRILSRTDQGYFVRDGEALFAVAPEMAADLIAGVQPDALQPVTAVKGAPALLLTPSRFILVGLNYASHAEEMGLAIPEAPMFGPIPGNSVALGGVTIAPPALTPEQLDYEGEIGVIIGRDCHAIRADEVSAHVLGVTAVIDLTLRDVQMAALIAMRSGSPGPSMTDAKGFPGAKPLGPEILLTDGRDLNSLDLKLTTHVNGELRQSAHVSELLFSIPQLIAVISASLPLKAGDVVCTGTPAGIGMARGAFLEPGDEVTVTLGLLDPLVVKIA